MFLHALKQTEAAALLNTTTRSLRDWEAAASGIPRNGDGTYDGPALVSWYVSQATGEELDPNKERARKDKEMADKLALQNAETRGDLAPVSVMERELGMVFADHRSNALGLPSKLAPRLVGLNADQIRDIIESGIYELLGGLADYRPGTRKADGTRSVETIADGSETSAAVHGKPVVRRRTPAESRKQRGTRALAN
jgi:hypothetical protein